MLSLPRHTIWDRMNICLMFDSQSPLLIAEKCVLLLSTGVCKMSRLLFQFIPQCRQQVLKYFIFFSSCSDVLYLFSGASRVLNTQSGPPAKKQRTDSGMGGIKRTLVNLTSGNSSSAPASKSITQLAQGKARLLLNIAVYVD